VSEPSAPEVKPFAEPWLRPYLDFAARAFGAHAYQADERYTRWLYDENPHGAASDGAVVIVEIAGHGFSHRPLTPADATRDEVRWELDALRRLDLFHDQSWTLVYPRNQIGYVDELGDHGIVGYRERRQPAFGRAGTLLSELNVVAAAEPHASDAAAIPIPAGFFLNWRSGGRRMVPAAVTVRRWTSLLRDAAKHDRVVHLWSHPHNFLTGDGMLPMFREIVRVAAAMCTRGDLVNMTQIDYAKRVKSLDAIESRL